jgi:hypothetical protein
MKGEIEAAIEHARRTLELAPLHGAEPRVLSRVESLLSTIHIARGELDEARQVLSVARARVLRAAGGITDAQRRATFLNANPYKRVLSLAREHCPD